jgi:hypothetical protein
MRVLSSLPKRNFSSKSGSDQLVVPNPDLMMTKFGEPVISHLNDTPFGSRKEAKNYKWTIYRPSRCVMQHNAEDSHWRIKLNTQGRVWTNPLMGWTASE